MELDYSNPTEILLKKNGAFTDFLHASFQWKRASEVEGLVELKRSQGGHENAATRNLIDLRACSIIGLLTGRIVALR
jgi:hypothetical protein